MQPPVAGSINWARSLFMRIRKTMRCFELQGNEMMKSPFAQEVHKNYHLTLTNYNYYLTHEVAWLGLEKRMLFTFHNLLLPRSLT